MWYFIVSKILVFLFRIFNPFKIYNKPKNLDGGAVFCCNHYKALDIAYMFNVTKRKMILIAKKQVFEKKVSGFLAKKLNVIPLNRDGTDIRAVMQATKILKDGGVIGIFPEGTRNRTENDLLDFKSGSVVLAIKSKTPVVPMMICNRPHCFKKTHIMVGEPIIFDNYYDKKCTVEDFAECETILRNKMIELKEKFVELSKTKMGRKQLSKM